MGRPRDGANEAPSGASFLAGRQAELKALEDALELLAAGRSPGIFQLAGEPGIGKTSLLAELATRAERRGYLVVGGRAAEFERELPFGVFVDALDDLLGSLDSSRFEHLPWHDALAAAFPALAVASGQRQPILHAERYRLYRGVRALLEELATSRPVVVLLDDLHWADPASVELVAHLLAHPLQGPVLVALAFRPVQTPPVLTAALVAAAREGPARVLELAPLTRAEADAILGVDLDRSRTAELYRESGGNPFYLDQLRRATLLDHPQQPSAPAALGGAGVPALVRAALAGEVASLPAPARLLLQGAAVAGDPFEVLLAAEAAAMGEAEALTALDELAERDLVRLTFVPRRFRFRHPIVRRAVYELAGAGWRVQAHARLVAALRTQGTPAAALAHHVERSARPGDDAAVEILVQAARSTAPRAPATAAHWYDAALRLVSAPEDDARRLDLLVAKATALGSAGRLEESKAALLDALARLPSGSPEHVRVTTFCAAVEFALGRFHQPGARLTAALAALDDPGSKQAVELQLELASYAGFSNDLPQMQQWAGKALAGAVSLGDLVVEAIAAAYLAWARCVAGGAAAARPPLERAASLFDSFDDAALAERLDLGLWMTWAEVWMERFDDAIRHCDRAVEVSRASGQGHFLVTTMNAKAWALLMKGRLGDAMEVASAAAESSRLATHGFHWEAVAFHALAASYAGDTAAAVRLARESKELSRSLDPGVLTATCSVVVAVVLAEAGDAEGARAELLDGAGGPGLDLLSFCPLRCLALETLTRVELALGRMAAAAEAAEQAEAAVGDAGLVVQIGIASRARASVLLAAGEPAEAAELAMRAASRTAGLAPLETARSRLVAGRALSQAGQRERAVAELESAEEELARCGAVGYLEQVRVELHRLGRRSRRRGGDEVVGLGALTEREWEIAELVSTGKSNREIGRLCCLSEKTVERHLSHIFAKLDVSSRAAVAGAIARSDRRQSG